MKRHMLILRSFFIATLLVAPWTLHAAGVYKWIDENGKVQYGDQPGNAAAEQVPLQATPPPNPDSQKKQEQQDKLLKVQDEERKLKDEEAVKVKQKKEERDQQCLQAKARLKNYERARYLYKSEQGNQEIALSDEERKTATEEVEKSIEELCN